MPSRIVALYHEHRRIMDAAEAYPAASDEEMDYLFYNQSDRIEAELMELPCQEPADFAAKAVIVTSRGAVIDDWETGAIWQEARKLIDAASCEHATPVQMLFAEWRNLQDRCDALEQRRKAEKVDDADHAAAIDPALMVKELVEEKLFATECQDARDLDALVKIAAHFDWLCPAYNQGVAREAARLAGEAA